MLESKLQVTADLYPLGLLRSLNHVRPIAQFFAAAGAGTLPAVIVSPYAKRDYVAEQDYDHTAILRLIQHKWHLLPLTARDAAAADLLETLDLSAPPAFLTPPVLSAASRGA
jgi:phospholipase C